MLLTLVSRHTYRSSLFLVFSLLLYCIDRRIYLNLSKRTQSAARLKALKPAVNGRYLLFMQTIALLFPFTVHKYIYPPISKVHAGSFRVFVIHQTLTRTTGSLTCVRDYFYACVYTRFLVSSPPPPPSPPHLPLRSHSLS